MMNSLFFARLKNRILRFRLQKEALCPAARNNLHALDALDPKSPAIAGTYVVIDIETTGMNKYEDEIVSIGALKLENGIIRLGQLFSRYVNTSREISPESMCVHGIRPDMLQNASPAETVLEELLTFIGGGILVAHHAHFDLHFLNRIMLSSHGFPLQNLALDTFLLSRHLLSRGLDPALRRQRKLLGPKGPARGPVKKYFDLDSVAAQMGIPVYHRHTAVGDALAAAMIFQQILSAFETTGEGKLKALIHHGLA